MAGAGAAGPPEGAPGGAPLVLRWVKPPRSFRPAALACRRVSRALPEATERAPSFLPLTCFLFRKSNGINFMS